MVIKTSIVFVLAFLAYTRYGMYFPKGSDVYLHFFGAMILCWVFEKPQYYFPIVILAEIVQPMLIPIRTFDWKDLFFNFLGAVTYFTLHYIVENYNSMQ